MRPLRALFDLGDCRDGVVLPVREPQDTDLQFVLLRGLVRMVRVVRVRM